LETKIIFTEDGSSSLYVPELNEHYHSTHGAITESMHVFIEAGLLPIDKPEINIFEIGFGTGLNALLAYDFARKNQKLIRYQSIELFPLKMKEVEQLNYPDFVEFEDAVSIFHKMHDCSWDAENEIASFFHLHKIEKDARDFSFGENCADVIFFDAFGPDVQPKLWTKSMFVQMFGLLKRGGVLVTYSAKGQLKRDLKAAGFKIEPLPGPPGKRQMTRARKD
jgi:tRNA U34 5-methylaminomethyl-2-thiouridine-forming methyltransferase MnmC